jgi:hypothetical protein
MKTKLLLVILLVNCMSFTPGTEPQWEGRWIENWGVGQETDIDYHDRYTISKDELSKSMKIWSTDKDHYRFCDVVVNGNVLELKLVNTMGYDTMPYRLVMEPGNNKMTGYAYSVHGRKMNIEWLREEE